nr:putative ribonuclease H-like domain-containing protein [Tanacetum cinerariifolium]
NDHIAAILGYGDLKWGNLTITRVYFVEGLGHNLFSVGQFCDADLEVGFGGNTCFIRYLDGVDLHKGNHSINLYPINLYDMASASPICLMARATPTKSWLWYQQLSHLNFDTINDLAKNDLVSGLPKFNYAKEHLCPSCEQGKSKRASHLPKSVPNSKQRLHMDLCGPMRVASINGKRYVLVIVDDYSRYTWVYFLRTKDETPEVIKNFLKKIYVRLQAHVNIVRTDNKTEFKIHVLKNTLIVLASHMKLLQQKLLSKNGVVERRNRTLVEAARTMLIFSHAPLFLWAKKLLLQDKKIMKTMNVTFDELSAMAFEQNEAPRTIPTAPVLQNLQASTASMSIQDSALTPTNSSNTPISSHNVDAPSQQHVQQQRNLTPSPTGSAAENVSNAVSEGDLFVNPFATPSIESVVSSTQYVDPSYMHTFY